MNDHGKSKEELILEALELQQKNNSLKASQDKVIAKHNKLRDAVKPSTLLLRILAIFAVTEGLIMFIFSLIDLPNGTWASFADSVLLAILGAPLVYWWVVKGLTRHLVSEITVAQTEAQINENRYQTLIDAAPDIIYTLDAGDGKITLLNPAFENVLGWPCSEWIGKTLAPLIHPEDLNLVTKTIQQTLKSEIPPPFEARVLTKSGTYVVGEFLNVPQFESGKIIGGLGIVRNVTDRKRTEQELINAKEKAEESDRLKSAFLANMSHEIRTPLNGILGFAELLKEPDLTGEKQQNYFRIIEKSGARMLNIITEIVDISKIQSGMMEVNLKESKINQLIEDTYAFFKPEVESKGMQLSFKNSLPAKEAIIKTDSEKIIAILTNLVKNAIKYSEKGSIEFGYNFVVETHDHASLLEFFVKDTGIGIAKDRQVAIFDRFVQADITDKQALQGAGLGLTITKAYVEMLGGKLWVESEKGKGSIFYFTIPCHAEPEKEVAETIPTRQ